MSRIPTPEHRASFDIDFVSVVTKPIQDRIAQSGDT